MSQQRCADVRWNRKHAASRVSLGATSWPRPGISERGSRSDSSPSEVSNLTSLRGRRRANHRSSIEPSSMNLPARNSRLGNDSGQPATGRVYWVGGPCREQRSWDRSSANRPRTVAPMTVESSRVVTTLGHTQTWMEDE